jgi:flagellar assembly protein FliH
MSNERKFLFDLNVFDAPPPEVEEEQEDLPPPPPTFSEEEMAVAKDMAFEQGRQQGQREQIESREQYVAISLEQIAQNFSQLFAAETMREIIFEKEALRLSVAALDLLFPLLNEKLGREEVHNIIEKTLLAHRKTKEIVIHVPQGMKGEIETLINRLHDEDQANVAWRVMEMADMAPGNCTLEWSDGGAVRDSVRAAAEIRRQITALFGAPLSILDETALSESGKSDVISKSNAESGEQATADIPPATEIENE